ncbi:lantibiotic dehydratase [Marinitenerispora sediminis]|uniref:Lantibiotic dehydratase n=1 Tax=Marinitenerispora sediminis TaxID=1931232 RepID=A0A368TAC2_9ACTN|nr:lantibiotic dehydratase [Marinitenerispora sediminis]RCV53982.1 lantibiotic dehydratase [Marinitenerispora sediminis]RCV60467.1 lantibiotic dehydratase [Marinitenerispora sediminis]RCV61852.1 lantibiotic dehydratase [Marinitenerispora sediminis]
MAEWDLVPTLVVRSAAFPWSILDGLRYAETGAALSELRAAERAAADLLRDHPPGARLPRGVRARLRAVRPLPPDGAVPPGWAERWNPIAERAERHQAEVAAAVERDTAAVGSALARLAADERFRDAVACSSPPALRDLADAVPGTRARRQIASYAQRLAAKCETMSFFGPINYADLDAAASGPTEYAWEGHQALRARTAHPAARVVAAVQDAVLADPALVGLLVPRRKTWARATHLERAHGPLAGRVLAAVDGSANVSAIAGRLGADLGEVAAAVRALVGAGALTHHLCPPATDVDPLGTVRRGLADLGYAGALSGTLDKIAGLLAAHPATPPEHKAAIHAEIAQLLPAAATDEGGIRPRFYNDRVIVHEAAAGTLRMTVRGHLAADLTCGMAPVLDLLAHDAELTRRATNAALARRLGPGRFPLPTAMRRCADLPVQRSDWLHDRIAALLPRSPVPAIDLAGRLEQPPPPELPVLCSVDVLPATDDITRYERGRTPLVVGDVHDAALLTPWALQFHPRAAERLADRDRRITAALGGVRALSVVSRRSTGLPPLAFPGHVLELGGGTDAPGAGRVGLDELVVDSDGETALLRRRGDDVPLYLHNGELETGVHTALALPRVRRPRLPDVPRLPRLCWGNIVLSRARVRVPSALFAPSTRKPPPLARRLADLLQSSAEHAIPDRFFAKSANERKPVYVDVAAPALLDGLARLAATADELDLHEVMPGPGQFWLADRAGSFAAEIRCVYVRQGGRP